MKGLVIAVDGLVAQKIPLVDPPPLLAVLADSPPILLAAALGAKGGADLVKLLAAGWTQAGSLALDRKSVV